MDNMTIAQCQNLTKDTRAQVDSTARHSTALAVDRSARRQLACWRTFSS
jgi:hypothetical protein